VHDIDTAVDESVREAHVGPRDRVPPQWIEATTTSPGRFSRRTRATSRPAVASDRSCSRSTPGRVGVAAHARGIPLVSVPQDRTITR
jgi:hypothetical protein